MTRQFCVYGDNIVECERMAKLIATAIKPSATSVIGNPTAPQYVFTTASGNVTVSMYPGFGRWSNDIIRHIRSYGGILREAPDIVLTRTDGKFETPTLAVEFCSALPAGNQAWQRSGRAYSTAKAGVPYLFITEIGGYELDASRNKKAPRMPNPAIPFSYFSFAAVSGSQMSIAYLMNPGADDRNKSLYANSACGHDLSDYLRTFILGGDSKPSLAKLNAHLLDFVLKLALSKKSGHLTSSKWGAIAEHILSRHDTTAIVEASDFPWKKKISIPTTKTFSKLFSTCLSLCRGVASCDLPFCIVPKERIAQFHDTLLHIYGEAAQRFSSIRSLGRDMAVCWYAGFKPKGDDARPDRGVLPLVRMLLGDDIPVTTVIYGPAPAIMTERLENNPAALMALNGLWESTLQLSDFVVCDSTRAKHPVLQTGKMQEIRDRKDNAVITMPANSKHFPEDDFIGENDVDTILHVIFAHLLQGKCHELMCNPPGGDWSGISFFDGGTEFRWLTLPRVSTEGFKRPDHVVQVGDIVLSIESKDYLSNLENAIGPRLNGYCRELFKSQPSCRRLANADAWDDKTDGFVCPPLKFMSACAFLESNPGDLGRALHSANTDIAIVVQFRRNYTPIVKLAFSKAVGDGMKALFRQLHSDASMQIEFLLP